MGFFSNLFKSDKEKEMERIFQKINKLLNDDETQTELINLYLKNHIKHDNLDRYPNAIGEFGRSKKNPILCNGALGEITYLSALTIAYNDEHITFHRLGSTDVMIFYIWICIIIESQLVYLKGIKRLNQLLKYKALI